MEWHIALSFGLILAAALIGGLVASKVHVPKVTAYLMVGLLLGPSLLGWTVEYLVDNWHLSERFATVVIEFQGHFKQLEPISKMAMALVLFNMGCHFTLSLVGRMRRRLTILSAAELSCTFLVVSIGLLIFGQSWQMAVLFGSLAMATAPATTILVLKESESEGPITEYTTAIVALNNLFSILLFEVLFLIVAATGVSTESPLQAFVELLRGLVASVVLGIIVGVVTSYICALLSPTRWLIFLIAMAAILLGICQQLEVPYMLAFLAMGTTVANSSDVVEEISAELDKITGLLCVVFFVVHGAEMDLFALWTIGSLGVAYIVLRSIGKYFGIFFFADPHHDGPHTKQWLGAALICQAGAAIALSEIAVDRNPEIGHKLQTVILGTVVFFELIGPVLVRQAVIRGAEVPLEHAIHHTTTSMSDELRTIRNRISVAFGRDPWKKKSADAITVYDLMRATNKGIEPSATFDDIVHWIEQSHDNVFPVVTSTGELVGIIVYTDVRDNLFDPELGKLVRASDLAVTPKAVLHPDDSLTQAWEYFRAGDDDEIPVVTREEERRLVGMVRRKDLLRLFRKKLPATQEFRKPRGSRRSRNTGRRKKR